MPMDALTPNMGCSENKDEGNGVGEDVEQATKYVFSVGKKITPFVAYEINTKQVATALGLPCVTVSNVFNESSSGIFYAFVQLFSG